MYKVFLNDREIVIAQPAGQIMFPQFEVTENIQTANEVKNWFSKFINETKTNALMIQDNPDEFMTAVFSQAFTQIEAAGGIVKRNGQMLFILRNEKWDLPKGKLDAGETPEEAAIREVEEECGIQGHQIIKLLPSTWHIYQSTWKGSAGEWILKKTHWFEMEYTGTENGTPETGENISEIRWFGKEDFGLVLENTYANLKEVIGLSRH
jgi:8-oxo-dGTP pyrophosphatase MutT (NUDIX family)